MLSRITDGTSTDRIRVASIRIPAARPIPNCLMSGPGPVESKTLGAWLVRTHEGKRVRLARNAEGTDLVPTAEERAAAAEARVRELEEQLARLRSGNG